jgi:hypothetical protein
MHLSKRELRAVVEQARQNFIDDSQGDYTPSEFLAKCYAKALSFYLCKGTKVTFEERKFTSPPEEGE